ncbi:response regulator [Methanospirillum stamsii]|uniref:response regulator n=1 Tax=Methanospirillum stamsii TaxID=1277351 RepID=UPI0031832D71
MTKALKSCSRQWHFAAVDNPADGIMHLKRESYDLVLLDIIMDPVDGWDTLARIRNLPNGVDIPVILFSVKNLQLDEIIRYGNYLSGFIKKPFVDAELCETLTEFFSWYDLLISNAKAAKTQGVPDDICARWVRVVRQIHAYSRLLEFVSPYCIPDSVLSDEECKEKRMKQINQIIDDRIKERDRLKILYPVFSL